MTLEIAIPDLVELQLQHLLLAVNGTLINRGSLLSGVDTRLIALRAKLTIHLVSADTFGTLEQISKLLQASAVRARPGEDDLRELERLGPRAVRGDRQRREGRARPPGSRTGDGGYRT